MDCSWIEPGVLAAGSIPFAAKDLHALHAVGIRALLSLTERAPTTFRELTPALLQSLALVYWHVPVPDQHSPTQPQAQTIVQIFADMVAQARPLFVHCNAGVGRTGTALHLH